MDKILDYFAENLPKNDSFFSLLIFLLMVFGGLYVLFQIIFYLGDNKRPKKEKPKKAEKKEEKKEPVKKEEEEAKKPPKEKKEKQEKDRVVVVQKPSEELIFLEEDKPYVEVRPQYTHEHNDSYIVGKYGSEVNDYSYGENYLYDYYNNGKTVEIYEKPQPVEMTVHEPESKEPDLKAKSDEIVNTYQDLPTELKRYILEKILSSGK